MTIRDIALILTSATSISFASAFDFRNPAPIAGFVENRGQFHDQFSKTNTAVLFVASAGDIQIQLKSNGFSYQIASTPNLSHDEDPRTKALGDISLNRIDFDFPSQIQPRDIVKSKQLPQYVNFSSLDEYNEVPEYSTITYLSVFPNVDIEFHISPSSEFKYSYILHEGADLNLVGLQINSSVEGDIIDNKLIFDFAHFRLEETIPSSWIESATGVKIEDLNVGYRLTDNSSNQKVFFHYNHAKQSSEPGLKVIIDPSPTVIWSTYYGGPASELIGEMSVQPNGVYLAGQTPSTSLIATSGSFQTTIGGNYDAFLAKFTSGGVMVWATYFGGAGGDRGWGVDQDSYGNVYLGGITSSNGLATAGAYQTSMSGASDAFFVKFNSSGIRQWSTYYGGPTTQDRIWSVHVDSAQDIYIAGDTKSWSGIATVGSHQSSMGGDDDAFLAKFSSSGSIIWATYYGGSGGEEGASITTSGTDVFMTGTFTKSPNNIATIGSYQPVRSGLYDTYLVKFNAAGVRLWGTYYGGTSNYDYGSSVDADCFGKIWLVGNTASFNGIATVGSHQSTYGGGSSDGFFACFNSTGGIIYASYYGGSSSDGITGVVRAGADLLYFVGTTNSSSGIATAGSLNPSPLGGDDGFITRFTVGGTQLWGTYFGAAGSDGCNNVGFVSSDLFVSGTSSSTSGISTSGAYQTYMAGVSDCFLTRFDEPLAQLCIIKNKDFDTSANDARQLSPIEINSDFSSLHYDKISNLLIIDSKELPVGSILSIHDVSGRLLLYQAVGSSTQFNMPCSDRDSQILIVQIITSNNIYTAKIVP